MNVFEFYKIATIFNIIMVIGFVLLLIAVIAKRKK